MPEKDETVRVVTLCGVQGCCPTLELRNDEIVVRDDYEGIVRMTHAQFADLVARARAGEFDDIAPIT